MYQKVTIMFAASQYLYHSTVPLIINLINSRVFALKNPVSE